MNEPQGDKQHDHEFDEYLRRGSPLSQRYARLPDAQPLPELDRSLLANAREAVDAPTPAARRPLRWMAPLRLAASIVLVFTVVLDGSLQQSPVSGQSEMTATDAVSGPVTVELMADSAPPAPKLESTRPLSAPTLTRQRDLSVPAPEVAVDAQSPAGTPAATAKSRRVDTNVERLAANRDAAMQAVAAPRAAAPPPPPAPAAFAEADRGTVTMERTASKEADVRSPDAWLKEIEQLRRQGRTAAADAEMKEFLETYPDYFKSVPAAPTTR